MVAPFLNRLVLPRSFADEIGCDVMNNLKACAKMKSLREILDAQLKVTSVPTLLPFGPVVDGYVLPGTFCFHGLLLVWHFCGNSGCVGGGICSKIVLVRKETRREI